MIRGLCAIPLREAAVKIVNGLILLLAVFGVAYLGAMAGEGKGGNRGAETINTTGQSAYERVLSTQTLRCGYFTWPPQLRKDPNTGKLSGILYDYVHALGGALGLKIEWTAEVGVGEYVEALEENRFDALCMTQWPDPPRVANSLMTHPAFYTSVYPAVRGDDTRFDKGGVEAFNNPDITIAVIDGDISATLAARDFPKAKTLTLPQMSDYSQMLTSIITHKADVTFFDYGVLHDFWAQNGKKVKVPGNWVAAYTFPEVFVIKKGEVALKQLLDTGINILTNNKIGDKILVNYTTSTFAPTTDFDEAKARAYLDAAQTKK